MIAEADPINAVWDGLYDAFASLPDPRVDRTKDHSLIDIISIAMCAVICGADSWVAVETFGKSKQAWLERYLALPNGIASHDTFGRVFAALDATSFQQHFLAWVQAIWPPAAGEIISVDGKTLRGSNDGTLGKGAIHLVRAWAQQSRLVLAHSKVDDKSNEITAIPALLALLDLKDCTVTIDAMGCQTAIARQIVQQGGEYVLAVKDNQKTLHNNIQQSFCHAVAAGWQDVQHTHSRTVESGPGRIETRDYWVITELSYLAYLNPKQAWCNVGGIGMMVSERSEDGQTSHEQHYYLLSGTPLARSFAAAVRGHWGIENCVHWVLDVTFREDASRVRSGNAPQNFAVLRHIARNLLRHEASKASIATKRFRAALDEQYLVQVLRA